MSEKHCGKCKKTFPIEHFTKDKQKKTGFASWCRSCRSESQAQSYQKNKEKRKLYKRTYRYENHAEKLRAHAAVRYALKTGKMERQCCELCEEPRTHAHHHKGYDEENKLNVQWLCPRHHSEAHHA